MIARKALVAGLTSLLLVSTAIASGDKIQTLPLDRRALREIGRELNKTEAKLFACGQLAVATTLGQARAYLDVAKITNGRVDGDKLLDKLSLLRSQLADCKAIRPAPAAGVLPAYDMAAWCRHETVVAGGGSYFLEKSCRDLEAGALGDLQAMIIDPQILRICVNRDAAQHAPSYWLLKSCIDLETDAKIRLR